MNIQNVEIWDIFSILLQHVGAQTDKKREHPYAFLSTENNSVHIIVSLLISIYNLIACIDRVWLLQVFDHPQCSCTILGGIGHIAHVKH